MPDTYRIKQLKEVARSLNLTYSASDTKGLIQLVKDCSIPPKFPLLKNKSISHILSESDIWEGRSVHVFDYLTGSEQASTCTMMLIRSLEFDFPFTSIQPRIDLFPPKQPLIKSRKKQTIERIRLMNLSSINSKQHRSSENSICKAVF